jgi:thioredoxin-like negative regulator of GroEL
MRRACLSLLLLFGLFASLAGQTELMTRAFEMERRSNFGAAADAYGEILRQYPDNLSALLGLERSLGPLRRDAELALPAEALLAGNPAATAAYSIAMRGWAYAGRPDSVASVASRWATVEPGSEVPYREWGNTLLGQRDGNGARRAYLTGRERLGDPAALAGELALLAAAQNNWDAAAQEWALAMDRYPGYRLTARNALLRAPVAEHERILRELSRGTPAARRLGAELGIQWGQPAEAFAQLMSSLPEGQPAAVDALRQFLDAARGAEGPEAARVRGQALEQLADRTSGSGGSRLRLEAARTYADGGDAAAARRMLAALAADGTTPPDMAAGAAATLVTVLLAEGQVAEAQRELDKLRQNLGQENADRLTLQVAEGWIQSGDLDRAEAVLASDSTIEALSVIGRIRLYRGDLSGATTALRSAGPFAGTREEATARTALLALIQPIEADSLPVLGAALFTLARGDSAAAVASLLQVADGLPVAGGGAELRLLAARVELARGQPDEAERLLRSAADSSAPATAPAAELVLARLLLSLGRNGEAVALLEHLILTYPGSASVPQARRVLDAARGGIPES